MRTPLTIAAVFASFQMLFRTDALRRVAGRRGDADHAVFRDMRALADIADAVRGADIAVQLQEQSHFQKPALRCARPSSK